MSQTWGPTLEIDGTAEFRIWAPYEAKLSLWLDGETRAMQRSDDGLFRISVARAKPGSRYGFVLSDNTVVADPGSRAQSDGVDGPSILVDPRSYAWRHGAWKGLPWEESVIYELHIGTFTEQGTFLAAIDRLQDLRDIGFTAIEIMPVAQFPGRRGWGYDGVLHFAPHNAYGRPDDLKALVDAAHGLGMMVFLDVVYNHFGPVGNYLPRYAPVFFDRDRHTPWGSAIAFREGKVRRYVLENVAYWLEEFRFDGLRFDAVDQIVDDGELHILQEISGMVARRFPDRRIHLTIENPPNGKDFLLPDRTGKRLYAADWNDDFHHVVHVLATGETVGHYEEFAGAPWSKLRQALTKGYIRPGKKTFRAATDGPSDPPLTAFVNFVQNHDQIGNRPFGERLCTLADERAFRLWTALLLLSPQIPLLFMGDEYGERRPFLFFADYGEEIGAKIRLGRAAEAVRFGAMPAGKSKADLPDPISRDAFLQSKLCRPGSADDRGAEWIRSMTSMLRVRREELVPLLLEATDFKARSLSAKDGLLFVDWEIGGRLWQMRANFLADPVRSVPLAGRAIYADSFDAPPSANAQPLDLPPMSLVVAVA